MHLSPQHGMTVDEIISDGFVVDERVESLLSADSATATVKSMGLTQIGMADALSRLSPDLVVILGDRYEMLASASAAMIMHIPVAHLHGGETTEGAYDDCIRHAITKLSWLHFASTPQYAKRIISMGEDPSRVFCVGAPGVENITNTPVLSLEELEDSIGFKLGERFIVATFHPVTLHPGEEEEQTHMLLDALSGAIAEGWKVLFTMPNSDTGGDIVARCIKKWASEHPEDVKTVTSLGRKRYFSALRYASAVVGNSSSGLIEVPSFGIPTLNIGDRQKGRARGLSVVDVDADPQAISQGLQKVLSDDFRAEVNDLLKTDPASVNPYSRPGTLNAILSGILYAPLDGTKAFFDTTSNFTAL